jgi:putative ABC transport system permease protein
MALYLSSMEVWRNKGRFFLFSLVIALITILVLFTAALGEGLANVNKEYLEKIDAQLFIFQENVDRSSITSRLDRDKLNAVRRQAGVKAAGPLGISNAYITFDNDRQQLKVTLIGVEGDQPGAPPVIFGQEIKTDRGNSVVIDMNVALQRGVQVGDTITIKAIQGTEDEYYDLRVIGISESKQYQYSPSIFIPYVTWDKVRPQPSTPSSLTPLVANMIAIELQNPKDVAIVAETIKENVPGIEVVDKRQTIQSLPGYTAQQSSLNTQAFFTLLIGVLVIGGFFQIQMLQKIPLIGVLKAIGTSNLTVALAVIYQIILVTTFGVMMGIIVTLALSLALPEGIPVAFNGTSVITAIISLLLIGPIGGLVSVRLAVSVEPLIALGLSQ